MNWFTHIKYNCLIEYRRGVKNAIQKNSPYLHQSWLADGLSDGQIYSRSLKYQKTEMKVMEWVSKGQALSSEGKPEGQTLSFKVNTYFSLLHILHGKFLESRRLREKGEEGRRGKEEEERKKKEEAERRKTKEEKCDML